MPRLVSPLTGSIVNVSDDRAKTLKEEGFTATPAKKPAAKKPAADDE